ncbi:BgTH12-07509 [Blumeria graminis f. sp. triticale]|uniref:Bgt-50948 n=2 Tax=Blumeria graminis TaxID=34373 RepID=A0A9X9PRZ4_BLUGR|nr:BgTH12-07509 [Blumeria graminis f. sp. triticale]VCU40586.1 Bgt-50948 [Blumeria graminis f. sp. tritici]
MKIFGLISFAAILNHLTPVLAASSYVCGQSLIHRYYIQYAFDRAHELKIQNNEQNYENNELFAVGNYKHQYEEDNEIIDVTVKVGGTIKKEILWVKALVKGEEIECKPATKEPKQSSAASWSS